jgi:hypothetical protein
VEEFLVAAGGEGGHGSSEGQFLNRCVMWRRNVNEYSESTCERISPECG